LYFLPRAGLEPRSSTTAFQVAGIIGMYHHALHTLSSLEMIFISIESHILQRDYKMLSSRSASRSGETNLLAIFAVLAGRRR
jgi:hypothetical protein